jgi:hypothetical protein
MTHPTLIRYYLIESDGNNQVDIECIKAGATDGGNLGVLLGLQRPTFFNYIMPVTKHISICLLA